MNLHLPCYEQLALPLSYLPLFYWEVWDLNPEWSKPSLLQSDCNTKMHTSLIFILYPLCDLNTQTLSVNNFKSFEFTNFSKWAWYIYYNLFIFIYLINFFIYKYIHIYIYNISLYRLIGKPSLFQRDFIRSSRIIGNKSK